MKLRNTRFAAKIALLPTAAGISFLVILAISWIAGRQGTELLQAIETGYYRSLELNQHLYEDLDAMQSAFQDAAGMADPAFMADAEELREHFTAAIAEGLRNEVVDVIPLAELESDFLEYYELAHATTEALIAGSGDFDIYGRLQTVADMHAKMLSDIQAMTNRDQRDVSEAFATAQRSQRYSTLFLIVVAGLSLILLVSASIFIIRMASQSINTTVKGIDALASGDLSQEFEATSNDEMGHMVDRVTHVTRTVNALTNEIEGLIDSVRAGELEVRGEPDKFQGTYARLIGNINELIDAFVAPIEVTARYVERISKGDLPPRIEEQYRGDFNLTKQNLNTLITAMNGLVSEVDEMTSAAKSGDLEKRGDPQQFAGVWRELVHGINDTLDAVTEPLQEFSQVMRSIAKGDLAVASRKQYQGEFADLQDNINATVAKLKEVISAIQASGDAVSSVANEISDGNQSLRLRTEDQASNLKSTSKTMENMTQVVRQNADSAQRAKDKVVEARDTARRGGDVVGRAVRAMDDINASSARIADIINVINEIAFQTNLLALNAAVEAARAGEEGKGFAVVASEVRNLAGRSATAAKEINDLIQDSVAKVEEGSRLVHESGKTLDEIVSAVADVTDIVTEISVSSQEQSVSIEEVNQAVAAMDAMTRKNAELADAAVRASDLMGEEARRLNRMTAFFTVVGDSAESDAPGGALRANGAGGNGAARPAAGSGSGTIANR